MCEKSFGRHDALLNHLRSVHKAEDSDALYKQLRANWEQGPVGSEETPVLTEPRNAALGQNDVVALETQAMPDEVNMEISPELPTTQEESEYLRLMTAMPQNDAEKCSEYGYQGFPTAETETATSTFEMNDIDLFLSSLDDHFR